MTTEPYPDEMFDYAELQEKKRREGLIVPPPEDRYSRPCGGKDGFDDFMERCHE